MFHLKARQSFSLAETHSCRVAIPRIGALLHGSRVQNDETTNLRRLLWF